LSSREAREGPELREEGLRHIAANAGSEADQAPSALQLRVRMLEMSPVFGELADGPLRALARRMRVVGLPAADKLQIGTDRGDAVVFLASGLVEQSLTDAAGRVLLTRRRLPGDLVILPVHRAGDRYVTSITGLANAVLLTLDRDSLVQGLGADVENVAGALDQLWSQELAAAEAAEVQVASRTSAPIVAFFSAKGGSGVTTLAVNAAAVLARTYPRQVLLIDLSAPFGHAALFSDLIATGSIASAAKGPPADFDRVLRQHIVYHRSGMGVLPGTLRPEEVDLMTGELTGRVLDMVVSWQRVIVVDLGTSLGEAALAVIERAECLVVVVPPEIAAMTDARRSLAVFRDIMNVPDNRIELVLNLRVPHPPLDRAAIESILGRKMSVTVGFDDSRPEDATLAGGLVLQRDASSLVSRGATDLARVVMASLKLSG
jgi:Flp pilus assembly CpaE family ATPase